MVNFINSIPAVLYGVTPAGRTAEGEAVRHARREGGVVASTIISIILLVLIGGAVYLLLNEKSFSGGVMARLRRFKEVELKEFADIGKNRSRPK